MLREKIFTVNCTICDTEADRETLYELFPYLPSDLFETLRSLVYMCFNEVIAETSEQALAQAVYCLSELIELNFPDIKLEDGICRVVYDGESFVVSVSIPRRETMYILKLTDFEVCSYRI